MLLWFWTVSVFLAESTYAWTGAIHSEIAWMAYQQTSSMGKKFLKHHLGNEPWGIAKAASWADSADAQVRYPHSEDWHFSHTPYRNCQNFDMKRDCGFRGSGRCLVTGIADMTLRAIDPTLSMDDRVDALRFVLHLVADIHQPMHTGFARDAGGVNISIPMEPPMSLHQLWDFVLLSDADDITTDVPHVAIPSKLTTRESVIEFASALATETSTQFTCKYAYQMGTPASYIVSGTVLSQDYLASRGRIAQERLLHAANRLASLLHVMGENFFDIKSRLVEKSATSRSGSGQGGKKTSAMSNTFAILDLEFSADDIASICEERVEYEHFKSSLEGRKSSVTTPIPASISLVESELEFLDRAIEDAVRERAAAHQAAELEKSRAPKYILNITGGGIELSSIVLVRRDIQYFLTKKDFVIADPKYRAVSIIAYKVNMVLRKRRYLVEVSADTQLFGYEPMSPTDLARILLYLKYGEDVPESAASGLVVRGHPDSALIPSPANSPIRKVETESENSGMTTKLFGRRVEHGYILSSPRNLIDDDLAPDWVEQSYIWKNTWLKGAKLHPKLTDFLDREFFSKLASVVTYNKIGNIQGYFHRETLLNTTLTHRRFNLFLVKNSGFVGSDQFYILMDTMLFDGMITPRIQKGMFSIDARASSFKSIIDAAPTLIDEMKDLNKVLNIGPGRKMRIIEDLVHYPAPLEPLPMFSTIEYEIRSPILQDV